MIKHGQPPYHECSSRGDKRFSSLYARPKSLNGQSIEEAYQAMKVFADGTTGLTWKEAKGKPPVNSMECATAFRQWWEEWVKEQKLLSLLQNYSGLSDMFGQPGHQCQATVLWAIRNAED